MEWWPEWQDPEEYTPTHRYCGVCDALVVIQERMVWPEEHDETKHVIIEMEPPPGVPLGEVLRVCKRIFGLGLSQAMLAMLSIQRIEITAKRHRIMCRSCEQFWWDDEECLCTCTDDQELPYEDWVVVDILD